MMHEADKIDLKDVSASEMEQFIAPYGKERYRTTQILRWLYKSGVHSVDEMTNLPKQFRHDLAGVGRISRLTLERLQTAQDGTKKFLFQLEDENRIETVLIPGKRRLTLCISTQVGCALGCRFCLTGKTGWKRNLRVSEMLNQILAARETLNQDEIITNIVMMGMGEPLANSENTLKTIELMKDPDAFKFSSRRITLSTVGLVPELERLSKEKRSFRLAISLNATDEETRRGLMPISQRYPLRKVLEVLRNFSLRPRERITFEYVMLDGINDSPQDARRLIRLLRGLPSKVNLIPLNEAPGIPFKKSPEEKVDQFQEILMAAGIAAIVRLSKGREISAACGQLGGDG